MERAALHQQCQRGFWATSVEAVGFTKAFRTSAAKGRAVHHVYTPVGASAVGQTGCSLRATLPTIVGPREAALGTPAAAGGRLSCGTSRVKYSHGSFRAFSGLQRSEADRPLVVPPLGGMASPYSPSPCRLKAGLQTNRTLLGLRGCCPVLSYKDSCCRARSVAGVARIQRSGEPVHQHDLLPGVLVIGHGTREPSGETEFRRVVEYLRSMLAFPVEWSFLEFRRPTIEEGVRRLVRRGVGRVVAAPLLLFAAAHIRRDIPGALARAAGDGGHVEICQVGPLDCHPKIVELSARRFRECRSGGQRVARGLTAL
ncbi:MAG TPA: hypothetical protein EYP56_09000, partial [Planctomycetaceae bacterium]|nr:hypothetical protein [Planctomycetaceae bacterium]